MNRTKSGDALTYHRLEGYTVEREIGHGSFAVVYKGRSKETNEAVAIKAINTLRLDRKLADNLATEIAIMKGIAHPHIVQLYDIQKTSKFIYLIMEYCGGGDLAQLLRRKLLLNEQTVKHYIRQIASALEVLHRNNMVHRDLKPQNLLLNPEGDLKMADFGFARYIFPTDLAETLCGSPLYMAPEILRYEKYDARADLWSVGAIMWEMLFGRPPFQAANHIQLLRRIDETVELKFPTRLAYGSRTMAAEIPPPGLGCAELLRGLLQKDPDKRFTFEQFFNHPFLENPPVTPIEVPKVSLISISRRASAPENIPRSAATTIVQPPRGSVPAIFINPRETATFSASATSLSRSQLIGGSSPIRRSSQATSGTASRLFPRMSPFESTNLAEEEDLQSLLQGINRPEISKDVELIRLGLILRELAEMATGNNSSSIMDSQSTVNFNRIRAIEAYDLILSAVECFKGSLMHMKEALKADELDLYKELIKWTFNKMHETLERLEVIRVGARSLEHDISKLSIVESLPREGSGSSNVDADSEAKSVPQILYQFAMKMVDLIFNLFMTVRQEMVGSKNCWVITNLQSCYMGDPD